MKQFRYFQKNIISNLILIACFVTLLTIPIGCKKYIQVDTPPQIISPENAFKDNQTAASVLTGIYSQISNQQVLVDQTLISTAVIPELSADDLTLYDPDGSVYFSDFYKNSLEPKYLNSYGLLSTYWNKIYPLVYTANIAIEGLRDNVALSENVRNRLLGEAYFMRGFLYFYLVNFYGGVPLVLTTKYNQTAHLSRSSVSDVYTQIIADLTKAEGLLDYTYVGANIGTTSGERVRPNLAAVIALEARVFLYQKNYPAAEAAATKVINQSAFGLTSLNNTFLKNSSETIWALQPVQTGYNTSEANAFILPSTGPDAISYPVFASSSLVDSFEPGDERKTNWLGHVDVNGMTYYYPTKYKVQFSPNLVTVDENTIVLRLSEQYLIRAEARNEQNNVAGAVADLNTIRARSRGSVTTEVPNPLPALSPTLAQVALRPIILQERRVELFTEWGHRWFDLKRSGTIDAVMTPAAITKGGIWNNYKSLYPIPFDEIQNNNSLTQNPGYSN